jgi:hypothetical protein
MALGPQERRPPTITAAGGIDAAPPLPVQQAVRPALVDELPESTNYVSGFTALWIPNPAVDFDSPGNNGLAAVYVIDMIAPQTSSIVPPGNTAPIPANLGQEFALTSVRFRLMSTNATGVNIWGHDTANAPPGYTSGPVVVPWGVHLNPADPLIPGEPNTIPSPLRPASGKTSAVLLIKNDSQPLFSWQRRRMSYGQPNNPAFNSVGVSDRPTTGIGQAIARCEFPPGDWSSAANIREISETYSMEADPVRFRYGDTLSVLFALSIGEAERIRLELYGTGGPSGSPYLLAGFAQVSMKLRLTHSPTGYSRIN